MAVEVSENQTQRHLLEILPDFEICSRRALEVILGMPTRCTRGFRILPGLNNQASLTCVILSENQTFQSALIIGMNKTDYPVLLPHLKSEEEMIDAVGEIANVIAGSFLGRPSFMSRFGAMLPSTPYFTFNESSLRKSWCIQGHIMMGSAKVFLGFTAQFIQKEIL